MKPNKDVSALLAILEEKQYYKEQGTSDVIMLDPAMYAGFDQEETLIFKEAADDFLFFTENIFAESFEADPFDFELNWHHKVWCRDLQRFPRVCELGPRYSLKSTISGHAFTMWQMLRNNFGLYVSYREDLAGHHLEDIKDRIACNRFFRNFRDTTPQSISTLRYSVGKRKIRVYKAGVFTSVRGLHPQWAILDDILPDATEKLSTPQELQTIERQFSGVFANLPTKGGHLVVVGTPQDPRDVLHEIKKRRGYKWRKLPAEDGVVLDVEVSYVKEIVEDLGFKEVKDELFDGKMVSGLKYDCLWTMYDKEWLREQEEAIKPKAYRREFLLQPASLSESFFQSEQIDVLIDELLPFYTKENPYERKSPNEVIVGGMDVGKKQHPTHIVLFSRLDGIFTQLSSIYLEYMDYTWQVVYVNALIEAFGVDAFYWDNSRAELEDRGLNPEVCTPVIFAVRDDKSGERKGKAKMATVFEGFVVHKQIRFLNDDRQKNQILQVRNDLKSAATMEGHGDAFFSCMLALVAGEVMKPVEAKIVGDVQELFKVRRQAEVNERNRLLPRISRWQFQKEAEDFRELQEKYGSIVDAAGNPMDAEGNTILIRKA